jgi:class 3 adenylate cyclase
MRQNIPGNYPAVVFDRRHVRNAVMVDYSDHPLKPSGMTVLVLDIHNFSGFFGKNRLQKGRIKDLLTRFFTTFSKLVADNDGTILKFIGDAIFCAFHIDPDNPRLREICREMLCVYHEQIMPDFGETDVAIIVMQSSELLEGFIGSDQYLEWSVFGVGINKMFHVIKEIDSAGLAVFIDPTGTVLDAFDSGGKKVTFPPEQATQA